jgi:phage baseplate assembly protein W
MATYIGFSTQNAGKPKTTNALSGSAGGPGGIRQSLVPGKKFKLIDAQLVLQDLINALNIRQGTKVGQPGYGSRIWDFVFEYNAASTQFQIENEISRVANLDPRVSLNEVKAYPFENGILVEIQLSVLPFNQPVAAKISFNPQTSIAILV